MTIIERTSYIFSLPEEKEQADEFEKEHKEWIKSISTQSICFSNANYYHQVPTPIEREEIE